MGGVRRLSRLGLLIAAGLMLALLERQFPPPAPVPGVRWGLANSVTLVALALEGPGGAFLVWMLRFLLVSIFAGSLAGPAFYVGGLGGLLAWGAMAALSRQSRVGVVGVSMGGAVAHHLGQVAAAAVVTATPAVFRLLPPLLLLAVPVGLLTGYLVALLLRRLQAARVAGAAGVAPQSGAGWLGGPRVFRRADLLVVGAALAGALLLLGYRHWMLPGAPAPAQAVVSIAGSPYMTLDLSRDGLYPIEPLGGHMLVEVAGGAVRVLESDCPDQICVLTGWVRNPGELVVCVPHRVVIQVTGAGGAGPDAILR